MLSFSVSTLPRYLLEMCLLASATVRLDTIVINRLQCKVIIEGSNLEFTITNVGFRNYPISLACILDFLIPIHFILIENFLQSSKACLWIPSSHFPKHSRCLMKSTRYHNILLCHNIYSRKQVQDLPLLNARMSKMACSLLGKKEMPSSLLICPNTMNAYSAGLRLRHSAQHFFML